jgi:hypothetical protein
LAATALCVLPAKETVEELFLKKQRMSNKQNVLWTFIIVFVSYAFAMFIPSIGDAMTLAGCTTNPMVNFLFNILIKSRLLSVYLLSKDLTLIL